MKPIRRLEPNGRSVLYLTFDDGPDPDGTPAVLEILDRYQAKATFFCIAHQAVQHPKIVEEIIERGHAVGNHSLDHQYRHFFRGRGAVRNWIREAEACLSTLTGSPTVGFRPPAGVRTPELYQALNDLRIPLILWTRRFYDAIWGLSPNRALGALEHSKTGDIVLFHDRQREKNRLEFLSALEQYVAGAKTRGYQLEGISIRPRSTQIVSCIPARSDERLSHRKETTLL